MLDHSAQVGEGYYARLVYNTLSRFISYYHQIEAVVASDAQIVLKIGAGGRVVAGRLYQRRVRVATCDIVDPN